MKSGIRDNRARGNVADFLREKVASRSHLSVVSAYFTIYAYDALAKELDQVQSCSRRLNIDPPCRFNIDPGRVVAV